MLGVRFPRKTVSKDFKGNLNEERESLVRPITFRPENRFEIIISNSAKTAVGAFLGPNENGRR